MGTFLTSLARVAASKIVAGLAALAVSLGVVIPLDESSTLTAALTLAVAAVLQLAWQIIMTIAEKIWPGIANITPAVLRVMVRDYTVRNVR